VVRVVREILVFKSVQCFFCVTQAYLDLFYSYIGPCYPGVVKLKGPTRLPGAHTS
jgi:hypothetical protein